MIINGASPPIVRDIIFYLLAGRGRKLEAAHRVSFFEGKQEGQAPTARIY
jgi:hypothetical protein